MTDTSSSSYKIKPLNGVATYPTWAIKLMDILNEVGLYEYVFSSKTGKPVLTPASTRTIPGATTDAPSTTQTIPGITQADIDDWETKQHKALSIICLRVADAPMAYIQTSTTGIDAWTKLQDIY